MALIRVRAFIADQWRFYRCENVADAAALIAVLKLAGIQVEPLTP